MISIIFQVFLLSVMVDELRGMQVIGYSNLSGVKGRGRKGVLA